MTKIKFCYTKFLRIPPVPKDFEPPLKTFSQEKKHGFPSMQAFL